MEIKTIEYTSDLGENPLTQEMKDELAGKSLEEQLDYFAVVDADYVEDYSYGEKEGSSKRGHYAPLVEKMCSWSPVVRDLIVSDGIIVGAMFHENGGYRGKPALLNQSACTYFCVDDDGTGSTCVTSYSKLIYVGKKSS